MKQTFVYEYQNRKPRVDKTAVKVNRAYDTDVYEGKCLAYYYGSCMDIAPVYNDYLYSDNIRFYNRTKPSWKDEKATSVKAPFNMLSFWGTYLIVTAAGTAEGKHDVWMIVKTDYDEFAYPLSITVADKKPTVSAKVDGKINLFYINREGQARIEITTSKDYYAYSNGNPVVSWKSGSDTQNGFTVNNSAGKNWSKANKYNAGITYPNVKVKDGQLVGGVDKGTVTVTLPGVRNVEFSKELTIATTYKKPVLVSNRSSSNVATSVGAKKGSFYVNNKTEKQTFYSYGDSSWSYWYYYSDVKSKTPDVTAYRTDNGRIGYSYAGSLKSVKATMVVDNPTYWREPLTVTHTIKNVAPKAVLSPGTITTNAALDDLTGVIEFEEKNSGSSLYITDADIQPQGKAKDLLGDDFITFYKNSYDGALTFNQNAVRALGGKLSAGSYKFKITPYVSGANGQNVKLNQVAFTLKVVDKPMSVKTTAKGSLDIAKRSGDAWNSSKWKWVRENVVKITSKFANLPTYDDMELTLKGEYADYFTLYNGHDGAYYIGFNGCDYQRNAYNKKLRAGVSIPLSIDYTIWINGTDGDTYPVTLNGGTFNVKIIQSTPKVTVQKNYNQILYAASEYYYRYVSLTVPDTSTIQSISGGYDFNGDGRDDIVVTAASSLGDSNSASVAVCVRDRDAVSASATGKTVKIPVKVGMKGSDGISADSITYITMKVKR